MENITFEEETKADETETVSENEMNPVDLSDVAERISEKNPSVSGFLIECDCFSDNGGTQILLRVPNNFAKMMLSTESAMQSMQRNTRMPV